MDDNKVVRFLLTFFLGFIGSIIINHTDLKPKGWTSRTFLIYILLDAVTFGIVGLIASVFNLIFDPEKGNTFGYKQDQL